MVHDGYSLWTGTARLASFLFEAHLTRWYGNFVYSKYSTLRFRVFVVFLRSGDTRSIEPAGVLLRDPPIFISGVPATFLTTKLHHTESLDSWQRFSYMACRRRLEYGKSSYCLLCPMRNRQWHSALSTMLANTAYFYRECT